MVRIRGTTPIPEHEHAPEHEPVLQQPASPALSLPSSGDIRVDQPRSSTPAPDRQSIPQQTPPIEAEDRHEQPPPVAAPVPPHPTVIQVPVPTPSRTAFIRMQSRTPGVTTVAQPPVSVDAAPVDPEPLIVPVETSPPLPTILTVPAPFVAPTSQVRVKGRTQDLTASQTLPLTEPPAEPTEPAAPTPVAEVPGLDTLPPSQSPVVIELPGEIPPATVDIALRRGTPVYVRSQPVGYSPTVIGTPGRPLTVTLRARSRSQVRGPPTVHEVPTSTAAQRVIYGRSDEELVVPGTRAEGAILRARASEAGSLWIHSPRPISAAPSAARHLEENLVNQEAQRARDAVIRQLLGEQQAFMEEHRAFMARAARTTAVTQDAADDTAAKAASLRASVQEAAEESRRHSSAMASVHSIVLDESAALAAERQRAQELEEKLVALRARRAEQRANRERTEQEKCERGRIAAADRHQDIRNQLEDITNGTQNAADEKARWRALQDQRWAEKQERQDRKTTQIQRLEEMMARIMGEQEDARHMAEEDAVANADRLRYAEVIAQFEQQNDAQLALLRTLLACEFLVSLTLTHPNINPPTAHHEDVLQRHRETVEAVLRATQEHVPFNISDYMNEFSRALAGEVTLLLQETGKLREEKRNIQHEIGCLHSLKQKYNPGGVFDPDWFAPLREFPLLFLTSVSGLLQLVIPPLSQLCQNLFNHLHLHYLQRSDPPGDRFRKGRVLVVRARDAPRGQSFPPQLFLHHLSPPFKRCHLSTPPCLRFRLCPPSLQWRQCSQCLHLHRAHRVR